MKNMTATDLRDYLATDVDPLLIDVRESHELANGTINGITHIPMNTLPARLNELEKYKNQTIVVICRAGQRSAQVGQYMEQMGFRDVINLASGMNGWATDVDPTMKVY